MGCVVQGLGAGSRGHVVVCADAVDVRREACRELARQHPSLLTGAEILLHSSDDVDEHDDYFSQFRSRSARGPQRVEVVAYVLRVFPLCALVPRAQGSSGAACHRALCMARPR